LLLQNQQFLKDGEKALQKQEKDETFKVHLLKEESILNLCRERLNI
jgi:hypothetical protein